MHLLAGKTERIDDGSAAVDLGQSPGDIVFISSADSELAAFAAAARRSPEGPSLRLVNFMRLGHPYSVDLFAEKTLAGAKLVVLRLIGGEGYWPYGLDVLRALARGGGPRLIVVSAEGRWDEALEVHSTVPLADCRAFFDAAVAGGPDNIDRALALLRHLVGHGPRPEAAEPLASAGIHRDTHRADGRPLALITFYRSLIEGGSTAPVDELVDALDRRGIAARAVFATSLKQGEAARFIEKLIAETPPDIVINGTAFALSAPGRRAAPTLLDRMGKPVLQIVFAGTSRKAWADSARGLSPRDMIMNIVLPEVDGRILTRPVSFKEELPPDPLTDSRIVAYRADPGRIGFVADQVAALVRLARKTPAERRVAIVLSNYPGRDGRFGNAVGLDTGESTLRITSAMLREGYDIKGLPASAAALMEALSTVEQASRPGDEAGAADIVTLPLADYQAFHDTLPEALQASLAERWGAAETDPTVTDGAFRLAIRRFGNVAIGVQPLRGFDLDQKAIYHDPLLPPPHHYVAFYAFLRTVMDADVVLQVGKHGNLEWLPGKAVGLSEDCWPEAVLGPLPLVYPFIVNDPGEGAQAKRRSSAVIVDHLMPPLARAEAHGAFAELETLIDEYHLALGSDPRRRDELERTILDRAARHGIDRDLRLGSDDPAQALRAIDAHLCDIKEMQIRDGLHVLGEGPAGDARIATLAAIARVPRTGGRPQDQSLVRALAADCGFAAFDPLAPDRGADWHGSRPEELASLDTAPWRTEGDTAERLEEWSRRLIATALTDGALPERIGEGTRAVLDWVRDELAPSLDRSGDAEMAAVLAALGGRFVAPGPSGAPSRGRPDVLPTGRNFYAVDTRAVPTEAAWRIGRKAAEALVMRYLQDEGEWPRSIALTVWGTANMRTGGDDIAEALALIGCEPVWEAGTGRVTGFRVLTLAELKRPRVDVTLRISGLFRDAFPEQIDLLDSAIRAVAEREEPDDANPIAAAAKREGGTARIFGSAPGAYGAGIESLMATGIQDTATLAEAFVTSGAHAYGGGREGEEARAAFEARLAGTDAVVQNQDNREHDILDSDEYHQFQGGFALAAEHLSGRAPLLYHGDHALAENPVIRPLGEEIGRVVRGRASNPRWIAGAMRHGWRGAAEIAASVDFLAGYAATTHEVGDHHFEGLFDAYLADEGVAEFVAEANPPAFAAMIARFEASIAAGLWQPRRNSIMARLAELSGRVKEQEGLNA